MVNFWHEFALYSRDLGSVALPESAYIAIPARPNTSELAEDLLVDPEALKLETHEPGIYDESGDYIPQYSDDPKDLELFGPTSLDAPEPGDTAPESSPAESDSKANSDNSEES